MIEANRLTAVNKIDMCGKTDRYDVIASEQLKLYINILKPDICLPYKQYTDNKWF